jgi:hypothetical protein
LLWFNKLNALNATCIDLIFIKFKFNSIQIQKFKFKGNRDCVVTQLNIAIRDVMIGPVARRYFTNAQLGRKCCNKHATKENTVIWGFANKQ